MADTLKSCASCAFYVPPPASTNPNAITAKLGECRANPPVTSYAWPKTKAEEWCGRWATRDQAESRQARKARPAPPLPAPLAETASELPPLALTVLSSRDT